MRTVRIFHPVGQGAFYSEHHYSQQSGPVNVVYDCGTSSKTHGKRVLRQAFLKGEEVKILFVSHFHEDHVNMIPELVKHVGVKIVVLPLMHEETRYFLSTVYQAVGHREAARMVRDPEAYFRERRIGVIQVRPVRPGEGEEGEVIDIDELIDELGGRKGSRTINSGTRLYLGRLGRLWKWEYVPWNYEYPERARAFKQMLSERGMDPDFVVAGLKNGCKKVKREVRKLYSMIEGGINANSLFVYSGPLDSIRTRKTWLHQGDLLGCVCRCRYCGGYVRECDWHPLCWDDRAGCVYSGDGQMEHIVLAYKKKMREIGTIQVPHHGSMRNFDGKVLERISRCVCVISAGKNNRYAHPSSRVIGEIFSKGCLPFVVDENRRYVECIEVFW